MAGDLDFIPAFKLCGGPDAEIELLMRDRSSDDLKSNNLVSF
jgi:hypothetical protein